MPRILFQKGNQINAGRIPWNKGKKQSTEQIEKLKKIRNTPDWAEKVSKAQIGKSRSTIGVKNGNWKGGVTAKNKMIRTTAQYRAWREAVFKRDDHTCQACGDRDGGYLHPHHINEFARFPDLRFNVNNGVTLHRDCHRRIHMMERMSSIESHQIKEGFLI